MLLPTIPQALPKRAFAGGQRIIFLTYQLNIKVMKNDLLLSNSIFYSSPLSETGKEYEAAKLEKKAGKTMFLLFSGIVMLAFVISKLYFIV